MLDRKQLPAEDQLNDSLFRRDYEFWVEVHRFSEHGRLLAHLLGLLLQHLGQYLWRLPS